MTQQIEQKIQAAYNQLPYPGIDDKGIDPTAEWFWINIDWIDALRPAASDNALTFKHILVAGCGTGNEAFQMKNRFPDAKITAVDYSEESIGIAQNYQNEHPNYADINFEVGDLTADKGKWVKTDHYDFITCHGVISYIPNAQNVFDLFAKCLSEEGICYIGANGSTHFAVGIRKSFDHLGYANNAFEDTLETRKLIELFDRLHLKQSNLSNYTPAYLDSDVLNKFNQNLTLFEWSELAEKSGLHLLSSVERLSGLLKTLSPDIFSLVFPKSWKELSELIEINNAAQFHRLIFGKTPPPRLPWSDFEALLDCRIRTTRLYSIQNPNSDIYGEWIVYAHITHGYEISFYWHIDDVSEKLFNQREGSLSIRDALGDSINAYKDNPHQLLIKLFTFYQIGIIKILPNTSGKSSQQ